MSSLSSLAQKSRNNKIVPIKFMGIREGTYFINIGTRAFEELYNKYNGKLPYGIYDIGLNSYFPKFSEGGHLILNGDNDALISFNGFVIAADSLDAFREDISFDKLIAFDALWQCGPEWRMINDKDWLRIPAEATPTVLEMLITFGDIKGNIYRVTDNGIYTITEFLGVNNYGSVECSYIECNVIGGAPIEGRLTTQSVLGGSLYIKRSFISNFLDKDVQLLEKIAGVTKVVTSNINVDGDTLMFSENTLVASDCPINTGNYKSVEIWGTKAVDIILIPRGDNPCIGPAVCEVSMGRYYTPDALLKNIHVSYANVICLNKVKDFSIGTFNRPEVPTVALSNGGTLTCPEMTGDRILIKQGVAPEGSTKISERPIYKIRKEGMSDDDLMSDELKRLRDSLDICTNNKYHNLVKYDTPINFMKGALAALEMNESLDITPMFNADKNAVPILVRTCYVLGLPIEWASMKEFVFESHKFDFLAEKYGLTQEAKADELRNSILARFEQPGRKLTDAEYLEIYESIPTYYFNFVGAEVKTNVDRFIIGEGFSC